VDPFELPDPLPATAAELAALADKATKEIRVFQARAEAGDELSTEDAERLEYLLDSRDTVQAAHAEATADEQDHTGKVSSLLDRAKGAAEDAAGDAKDEAPADADADASDDDDAAGDGGSDVVAEAEQITEDAADRKPVAAAAPVSFAGAAGGAVPAAGADSDVKKGWEFLPSAPKYGEFGNAKVGSHEIALAIDSVGVGQRTGRQQTGSRMLNGASFATQAIARMVRPHGKVIENAQDLHVELERIALGIPGQSGPVTAAALVAAGGWCSPSETLYDFCPTAPAQGLVSLPEVNIKRGGIQFPAEPDFSGLLTGFHFTEAELQATNGEGVPTAFKECVEVPCPDEMVEYRLEAIGYCIEAGILQRQGWPELIEKFVDEFMVAHFQRLSRLKVAKMVAASDAKTVPNASVLGATSGVLNGLHVQARNLQIKTRKTTIEGVAPIWFRDVLRADLALRDGTDVLNISDAQIDAWLAVRGIYLQYEGTWQSLEAGQPGHLDTTEWPDSVQVLLYPAGTFFQSLDNVITFGVQYPMDRLQVNRYSHAFVEDSFMVGKRCDPSLLVTVPLCVNGAIGAREQIVCGTGGGGGGTGEGEGEGEG